MNLKTIAASLAILLSSSVHAGVGQAWAWDAGKTSNNGSVTLRSNNGSSSYSVTQNPTGAVAKANQSSVTQPPTVIIQATSGTASSTLNPQVIPLLVANSTTSPTCPTGYTAIWTLSSASYPTCNMPNTYNIGGSRFSFGYGVNNNYYVGWYIDSSPTAVSGASGLMNSSPWNNQQQPYAQCYSGGTFPSWAATLCTK